MAFPQAVADGAAHDGADAPPLDGHRVAEAQGVDGKVLVDPGTGSAGERVE